MASARPDWVVIDGLELIACTEPGLVERSACWLAFGAATAWTITAAVATALWGPDLGAVGLWFVAPVLWAIAVRAGAAVATVRELSVSADGLVVTTRTLGIVRRVRFDLRALAVVPRQHIGWWGQLATSLTIQRASGRGRAVRFPLPTCWSRRGRRRARADLDWMANTLGAAVAEARNLTESPPVPIEVSEALAHMLRRVPAPA